MGFRGAHLPCASLSLLHQDNPATTAQRISLDAGLPLRAASTVVNSSQCSGLALLRTSLAHTLVNQTPPLDVPGSLSRSRDAPTTLPAPSSTLHSATACLPYMVLRDVASFVHPRNGKFFTLECSKFSLSLATPLSCVPDWFPSRPYRVLQDVASFVHPRNGKFFTLECSEFSALWPPLSRACARLVSKPPLHGIAGCG